jgi:hypothetical protein
MWIFVRYGFYSIASASKPDGSIDGETVMVRARSKDHLQNLPDRFSALADAEIVAMPNRDYRYRLITPKRVWVPILAELAEEQDWSNFKNEGRRISGKERRSLCEGTARRVGDRVPAPALRRWLPIIGVKGCLDEFLYRTGLLSVFT